MRANLLTNSPRVRVPVAWGRVMGERVSMNREGGAGFGVDRSAPVRIRYESLARPEPYKLPILPGRLRNAEHAALYRRAHAHRVVGCDHLEQCVGTRKSPCKPITERRAPQCDVCK